MKKQYLFLALLIGFGAKAQIQVSTFASSPLCDPTGCTQLTAEYPNVYETTGYTVVAEPFFSPPFPTTGGTLLDTTADDIYSPVVNLPFNFNFYGVNYNQLLVGSNGMITFDLVDAGGFCPWAFTATVPSIALPKNAIFGVYQDNNISSPPVTNPAVQNVNYYILDTGQNAAPNRLFVANFNQLPQFQCNSSVGLQTSQIVLHEGTNIIDVFVFNRTPCSGWNSGSGLIGVQDATGTTGVTPPARNTGNWSASQESWRFFPIGIQIPATLTWSQNGVPFSNQNPATVCYEGSYMASVNYTNGTISYTVTDEIYVAPAPISPLQFPADLVLCTNDPAPYYFDLTSNEAVVLGAENPQYYDFWYYDNLADAQNMTSNSIANPENYSATGEQTIYMAVEDLMGGCTYIKPFNLEINPIPEAPIGNAMQTFTPGETLAALEVIGENIQWYDQSTDGNLLPSTTPLVNNTTYYAAQTLNGCTGRMSPGRLAVTATSTLNNKQFTTSDVVLFPNPASNTLTVSFPKKINKISIYNTLGQLVLVKNDNQKELKLDVATMTSGTYFIKINSDDATVIAKFVKK